MLSQFCPELCYQQTKTALKLQAILSMLSLEVLKDEIARKKSTICFLEYITDKCPSGFWSSSPNRNVLCWQQTHTAAPFARPAAITEVYPPQLSGVTGMISALHVWWAFTFYTLKQAHNSLCRNALVPLSQVRSQLTSLLWGEQGRHPKESSTLF